VYVAGLSLRGNAQGAYKVLGEEDMFRTCGKINVRFDVMQKRLACITDWLVFWLHCPDGHSLHFVEKDRPWCWTFIKSNLIEARYVWKYYPDILAGLLGTAPSPIHVVNKW